MGADGQADGGVAPKDAAAKFSSKIARPKRKAVTGTAPASPEGASTDGGAPDPADSGKGAPAAEKAPGAESGARQAAAANGTAPVPDSLALADDNIPAEKSDVPDAQDDDQGEEVADKSGKKRAVSRGLFNRNKAGPSQQSSLPNELEYSAFDKPRHWELILNARAFQYVGADKKIDCFFAVSVRPEDQKKHTKVQLLSEYTPAYILPRNERHSLGTPVCLYDRKKFVLSYHQMQKHVLQIDMWTVSGWTFNQFSGQARVPLWDIARNNPNRSIKIAEKLTKKDQAEKKKMKRPISDVAVFECTINMEEIFDFHLLLANWRFEYAPSYPDVEERLKEKMALTFILPKSCYSDPLKRKNCRTYRVPWRGGGHTKQQTTDAAEAKFRWQQVGKGPFIFRGTRTSLTTHFFIVNVHSGRPIGGAAPMTSIGSSLMGLTSVLTISVFKGRVKALSTQEECFNVGTLTGNVQALMCSINEHFVEEIPGGRPEQNVAALSITSLLKMRYLVIRVTKCEGLAVADSDTFSSDPFLLVVWDSMVQKSPVLEKTTAPVFNYTFYFPVRSFNQKLETPRYYDTALLYELKAKGDISIQVWDDDGGTSADSLGFVRVPLRSILANNYIMKRNLRGKVKDQKGEDDDDEPKRPKQWYDQEEDVRLFDGSKSELFGCSLPNSQAALIYFEVYFFPDFPDEVAAHADRVLKLKTEQTMADAWRSREKAIDRESSDFAKTYAAPFPDSIGAKPCKEDLLQVKNLRRFPVLANHPQTLELVPLMAFLVKITTDDAYNSPMLLLHWMNCITFCNPPSQDRTGLIPAGGWKDPQYVLFTRKGPAQDHALLLCSVLLGSGWEAYVCKGTVWSKDMKNKGSQDEEKKAPHFHKVEEPMKLVEHTWVMTREEGGWVTFWEPCTRELYHLPHRWTPVKSKKAARSAKSDQEDDDESGDEEDQMVTHDTPYQVADTAIVGPDVEDLPIIGTVRRVPKAKEKSKGAGARDRLRQEQIAQREMLPTAPQSHLLTMDEKNGTFVDWLPYDSIDVVFNMDNVWLNRHNHHPACIMYDFEPLDESSKPGWSKLLRDEEDRRNLPFDYISADVFMDPALKKEKLTGLELETINEMEENMRLYRQKRGHDTWWDKSPELLQQLTLFLDIHERMKTIDVDLCPLWQKRSEDWDPYERYIVDRLHFGNCRQPWNRYGTPYTQQDHGGSKRFANYRRMQMGAWEELMGVVKSFVDRKKLFPTKKGKVFTGFPVHFCTVDKNEIRRYLMQLPEYRRMLERTEEGLDFTIHCKIYGFLGGIQSCWIYFGVQSQQEEEKGPE